MSEKVRDRPARFVGDTNRSCRLVVYDFPFAALFSLGHMATQPMYDRIGLLCSQRLLSNLQLVERYPSFER